MRSLRPAPLVSATARRRITTAATALEKASRLDSLLSTLGYCTRSESAVYIRQHRVRVSDQYCRGDAKVAPSCVVVDGEPLEHPQGLLILLHKPVGCVCSRDAREGPSVFDLLPPRWSRRHSPALATVGRLDRDTTGVLLVTDQGQLVQRYTSPRRKLPKVYDCLLDAPLADFPAAVALCASGLIVLDGEPCAPALLEPGTAAGAPAGTAVRLTLTEGRHHQVKRMLSACGRTVIALHRAAFGPFSVEGLEPGQFRVLPLPDGEQEKANVVTD